VKGPTSCGPKALLDKRETKQSAVEQIGELDAREKRDFNLTFRKIYPDMRSANEALLVHKHMCE
jgi:hypothetical protein